MIKRRRHFEQCIVLDESCRISYEGAAEGSTHLDECVDDAAGQRIISHPTIPSKRQLL